MSLGQPLPSFKSVLHPGPDHYKTVLPNLSFPHRPITHVPWTSSSRPLRFSVSWTVFFLCVLPQPYLFFLRKQRVRTWQSLLVFLPLKLVYIYFFLGLILSLTLTALTLQAPAPTTASTCCDTSSLVPTAFHGVGMFIWVSFDWSHLRVCLLIPLVFL